MRINPARVRSLNRKNTPSDKSPSAQNQTYMAPVGGMMTNTPLASPQRQTALVLENFWPTATGIEPRGGTKQRCTISGGVEALFQYRAGIQPTYFAADTNHIYEFSDATLSGSTLSAVVTGQTSADYSVLEMQTDGGAFLTIVNGQDHAQIYDGTHWQPITNTSTPFAITQVATDRLSHVWSYRNRTFFIERATMNAWYLGINSVAGPASRLPLSGVFNKGGALLFGATWSSDSGAGMDDRCVFATNQGEFAVFSGGNPGDASDWQLNGVYDIGEPLGKNAIMQVGGDLIVATKAGLMPISAATTKDPSQLKLDALSYPVDTDWRREAILSGNISGWRLIKWDSRNMAIVAPPNRDAEQGYCWAVNMETGAWTKFTGWRIGDIFVLGNHLYYGDDRGNIYRCDVGGFDNNSAFECRACFSFDNLGMPGALETAHAVKGIWRYRTPFSVRHTIGKDYKPAFGAALSVPLSTGGQQGKWDESYWDQVQWANNDDGYQIKEKWESVSAQGEVLAPQVQITSAQSFKLDCELVSIDLMYSTGGLVV
ncbi:hypothetical protein [Vibrio penaeicida]|uniref:hypothetical protein n=1 Tax=Vibrio penaeicida TaxID=104609 RepID=UPI001CC648BF|nr:hypothetical protein [Vibrio penaeicida]